MFEPGRYQAGKIFLYAHLEQYSMQLIKHSFMFQNQVSYFVDETVGGVGF